MRASFWLVAAFALVFTGCGEPVDLTKGLQILDISSGWRDAGVVAGQNKLVPSITFRVKNASGQQLNILQVNAVFRHVNNDDEFGSSFMTVAGSKGLAPGASSEMLTLSSSHGYTGIEPEQLMIQNSQFVDARVHVSAKYGSVQLVRLTEIEITRRLIGR